MSIDWITVTAQLANFLVLVWLLKRFLYRPILDGIDAREAEIAERMQIAARTEEDAKATEADYRAQLAALQSEQATMSEAARQRAEKERDTLLAEANNRIERERTAWMAHLDEEARSFKGKMQRTAAHALLELTRKALADLADETLESRIAAHLARQIGTMDGDLEHAAGHPKDAVVTCHASLPNPAQEGIRTELRRRFPNIVVRFDTDPTQAPGLTLQIGGVQLAWTVDTYIDGLNDILVGQLAVDSEKQA